MSTSTKPRNTELFGRSSTTLAFNAVGLCVALAGTVLNPEFLLLILLIIAVAIAVMLRGAVLWYRHRNPRRPREPHPGKARLARLPRCPDQVLPLLSSYCVICGRPLTSPESQRARVGTTCIKKHGPKYATKPNPEYIDWLKLKSAAEADRDAEQTKLDAQHKSALAEHALLTAEWEAEMASPVGIARNAQRRIGMRLFYTGAASSAFLLLLSMLSIHWAGI
ncbi:DUF6011 domain-containing protein [Rhodococcus sp. Q]|uniref:DUF6011 domain-containing protein n=1 Tax=Rhodococcus sp. Q TaxID=2502252 RepID=UPI0010F84034|nr:DUF6011 domain-containing protein [Rhodococcus sp. Q]